MIALVNRRLLHTQHHQHLDFNLPKTTAFPANMFDTIWNNALLRYPVLAAIILLTYAITDRLYKDYRIARLGARAPIVHGWLPLNVDVVLKSLRYSAQYRDLDFWAWLYRPAKRECPTSECMIGGRRILFTAQPENIKAMLATQFGDYGKGEPFHQEWKAFLGDSIFTTDGDLWHGSRQLIRPQFVKSRVSDLELFERHSQKLLRLLGGQGQSVDIDDLFYRFTLDVSMDFLLGSHVNSLEDPQTKFAEAFMDVQALQAQVPRLGPFHHFLDRRRFWKGLAVMEDFVQPIITQCLALDPGSLKDKEGTENQSFLQALATVTRDRQVIRDQIVAVLLAGRDTTAGTLSFLFYELSQHPEIVAKIRQEIESHVGMDKVPTYDDLKGMSYLQHCLSETLRLYPAVPFNIRLALKDTTLPTGGGPNGDLPIGILKDTGIGYSTLYMQRRPDLYPAPSPTFAPHDQFSPERWETWQPKAWNYIPFNGGPRICIGQQFALTEMAFVTVRILQRFGRVERLWDWNPEDEGSVLRSEIVLSPRRRVKVGLWEAEDRAEDKA